MTTTNQPPRHEDGRIFTGFPHTEALDIRGHDSDKGVAFLSVPYREELVGDPETGVIHGGVISTLLDTGCGLAAITSTGMAGGIATLDLRIDYMRPAIPGRTVYTRCECYRVTRSVAFTRGVAYEDDPENPVATAAGAFMITKPKKKVKA
ncbi:MAG: PaaI family thioesterase [Pikeienuella sp.]